MRPAGPEEPTSFGKMPFLSNLSPERLDFLDPPTAETPHCQATVFCHGREVQKAPGSLHRLESELQDAELCSICF